VAIVTKVRFWPNSCKPNWLSRIEWVMSQEKLKGRGRLVPAQATGIEYKVEFGIDAAPETLQYGRGLKPTTWAKCSIHPVHARVFPDGHYFLHADDGRVHQLKAEGGKWHCLALAA
jgi:hypothetical protein